MGLAWGAGFSDGSSMSGPLPFPKRNRNYKLNSVPSKLPIEFT